MNHNSTHPNQMRRPCGVPDPSGDTGPRQPHLGSGLFHHLHIRAIRKHGRDRPLPRLAPPQRAVDGLLAGC
jgi:hypothetical protein